MDSTSNYIYYRCHLRKVDHWDIFEKGQNKDPRGTPWFLLTVSIRPKNSTTQTRFSETLAKSVLLSGSYKMNFGSTYNEDLQLGQCLDIDDMTSPSKFIKSRDLVRIFWPALYFTDRHFLAFHILLYNIANLRNINLKFQDHSLTSILIILQYFVKATCLKLAFPKIGFFGIFSL